MDFIADQHKRCFKEARELFDQINSSKETAEAYFRKPVVSRNDVLPYLPQLLRYNACITRPLLRESTKKKFDECIKNNNGNILECEDQVVAMKEEFDDKFKFYREASLEKASLQDLARTTDFCRALTTKAFQLQCSVYPEKEECKQLKQQALSCYSVTACNELVQRTTECFKKFPEKSKGQQRQQQQLSAVSVLQDFATGVDSKNPDVRASDENYCNRIKSDMLQCFEKYFTLSSLVIPRLRPEYATPEAIAKFKEEAKKYGPKIEKLAEVYEYMRKLDKEQQQLATEMMIQQSKEQLEKRRHAFVASQKQFMLEQQQKQKQQQQQQQQEQQEQQQQ